MMPAGRDLIGIAATGSGKTLAFVRTRKPCGAVPRVRSH